MTTHGHSRGAAKSNRTSSTYKSWQAMLTRCTNPRATDFAAYGGAGVTVCERWRDFSNFLADMGERPTGTVLDRERNNKGYQPGNCRWLPRPLSNVNRRNVTLVLVDGIEMSLKAASELRRLSYPSMRRLMKSGLSFDQAAERLKNNRQGWFRK